MTLSVYPPLKVSNKNVKPTEKRICQSKWDWIKYRTPLRELVRKSYNLTNLLQQKLTYDQYSWLIGQNENDADRSKKIQGQIGILKESLKIFQDFSINFSALKELVLKYLLDF